MVFSSLYYYNLVGFTGGEVFFFHRIAIDGKKKERREKKKS